MKYREYDIAIDKVQPYLERDLGWPLPLIKGYGRVPVQIGTSTRWADFVCYIVHKNKPKPYLLVEVKQENQDLDQVIPQAESYSLILDAPFFCVTDGKKYIFYLTGQSQGNSIRISGDKMPIPTEDSLPKESDFIQYPPQIDAIIESFFQALKMDRDFLKDTVKHSENLQYWNRNIFSKIDSITASDLGKTFLEERIMIKPPNAKEILAVIHQDIERFRAFLKIIAGMEGDLISQLSQLLDKNSSYHIRGAGLFFITQLLAAAHPETYVVLEENVANALRDLNMTDVLTPTDVVNGYVFANDICKRIYKDKLESQILAGKFGLAPGFELVAVHNFLWHYHAYRKQGKSWSRKDST